MGVLKILVFKINNKMFAADINDIERIIKYEEATYIPDMPTFVEGVINYEEKVIPSINLNKKLGLNDEILESRKIIVIRREEKRFAVVVDNVYEVCEIKENSIEDVPINKLNMKKDYIKGLIKLNENIVVLLNLFKILTESEEEIIFLGEII
ncbi:chemotaxis protein CheW [Clostridium baratii]|uniref:chemotaxis protein CheW n=1 Tax=Clostridium baratii TaxID=1561 RepID=UPI0009A3ADDE|nr:chemotaxis protein CheW [Clostridium baratii]OPF50477.1 chemotaxis protein CheW [Clostridium baratii]OPF53126.1 chemotaxis protein CheW [Clostridium baratii]OPF55142.1 chemotaxis protein CheW [Clostridium baratii]OPF61092.1 chemotaxis protein CheW [Clostridium baratii]